MAGYLDIGLMSATDLKTECIASGTACFAL